MKILVEVRHPAHIHHFKFLIWELQRKGYKIIIIASQKDVLIDLLKLLEFKYKIIGTNQSGLLKKIFELIKQDLRVFRLCRQFKPDLIIGRPSQPILLSSFLLNIKSIIFAEDDFTTVFFNGILAYPFAKVVLTPKVTDLGYFNSKKIGYSGYQKLAYLHPNYFKPDANLIKGFIDISKPYFILRFAKLHASHDLNVSGISDKIGEKLIQLLESHGNIYITSERRLVHMFNNYRLKLPSNLIHHALYYAKLYIGDSQTMTAEAAVLGTPALRFNDFVGKLGYLEELEHKYGLTYGIKTSEPDKLYQKIEELLNTPNLKQEWQNRRRQMLSEKIDVTAFMVWFVENYPESAQIMKANPDYQYNFK